jgi:hypothetical protein
MTKESKNRTDVYNTVLQFKLSCKTFLKKGKQLTLGQKSNMEIWIVWSFSPCQIKTKLFSILNSLSITQQTRSQSRVTGSKSVQICTILFSYNKYEIQKEQFLEGQASLPRRMISSHSSHLLFHLRITNWTLTTWTRTKEHQHSISRRLPTVTHENSQ